MALCSASMALADITRHAVLAAMAEFDRLGREVFLETYKFGRALSYFLEHDGKQYDSKAIAGYAHGEIPGQRRWTTGDFTGGEASVARHLRDRLGFTILIRQNADWTRDELILACDLVSANGWHELRAEFPEVGSTQSTGEARPSAIPTASVEKPPISPPNTRTTPARPRGAASSTAKSSPRSSPTQRRCTAKRLRSGPQSSPAK